MGWTFGYETDRKRFIESITSKSHFSGGYTPLEHRVVGNHVWQLVLKNSTGDKFISLALIAKERNGGWGYKGLSEDMGPCYYDCPLSLIDKATAPVNQYAADWRNEVRKHHAEKAQRKQLQPGTVITFGNQRYRLDQRHPNPHKGWLVSRVSDGMTFRISNRNLAQATFA